MLWTRGSTSARSNGLLTKSLAPAQGTQLVRRLGGDDEHRQIAAGLDLPQVFHDLEAVHHRHLQVEKDQVVAIHEVQLADLGGSMVEAMES